jgi:uncharacterized protein YqhQ
VAEFNYGGQAVMEGVMMRGSKAMAVAIRAPNGQIVVRSEPLNARIYGGWLAKVPVLRGITMLWDTLVLGTRTLMLSADIAAQEPAAESSAAPGDDEASAGDAVSAGGVPEGTETQKESLFSDPAAWGTMAFSLGLGVALFFLLPALLAKWLDPLIDSALLSNLVESLIRLALVLGYVWAVGFVPDIGRVYAYHGAEHKTVHAYEAGEPLTVEAVQSHTTAHTRCGTAFILIVVFVSVLIFTLLGRPSLLLRLASRIVFLPLISGIAYEWLKFSARHESTWWARILVAPGLAMQKLTTREPDDKMVEVAIVALKRVLEEDGLWAAPETPAAAA